MPIERDSVTLLSLNDFSGGINNAVTPQALAPNEYQLIKNLEFNMNTMQTRGGLSAPLATYDDEITAFCYDNSTGCYLVCLKNGDIYEEDLSTLHNKVGTLTGTEKPFFCFFDSRIFIASGGHLQYYDYKEHTVTTIEASKLCNYVFERFGRLVVCHTGDDNLYYTAIGDPYETGWTENTNDDSSFKFVEIGYKDNGDILKFLPLRGDLGIFKSNGRVYSLSNEYPYWSLQLIGENSDVVNKDTIINLGSSVAFMTKAGLKTIDAVQVYGNFNINEIGRKFNRSFIGNIYSPQMFNIIRKRQLLIVPNTSDDEHKKQVFCYQYDIGAGIYFEFSVPVTDMQDTQNGVMLASKNQLYRWDAMYINDNGTPIEQEIITKQLKSVRKLYTRRLEVSIQGNKNDLVEFHWDNKVVKYRVGQKRNVTEFFNVSSKGELRMKTKGYVALEYVNLYLTEK